MKKNLIMTVIILCLSIAVTGCWPSSKTGHTAGSEDSSRVVSEEQKPGSADDADGASEEEETEDRSSADDGNKDKKDEKESADKDGQEEFQGLESQGSTTFNLDEDEDYSID